MERLAREWGRGRGRGLLAVACVGLSQSQICRGERETGRLIALLNRSWFDHLLHRSWVDYLLLHRSWVDHLLHQSWVDHLLRQS